jgi:general secretion pathway protein I
VKRDSQGFTLIEVMIALAIFAVTASTVVLANIQTLKSTRQIEEQVEARWVNQNILTQMRIEHQLPKAGVNKQDVEFNNKIYVVEVETSNVEMEVLGPYLRRVQLRATLKGEDSPADVLDALLGEASAP